MMNIIMARQMERDEAFRRMMRSQKCPFRFKTETSATGTTHQYMMECDPDCLALVHQPDKSCFSCLRLMNVHYNIPAGKTMEIFRGIDKNEEE